MSYGIVRCAKCGGGGVKGIEIHDNRLKEYSHSNPDIDFSKSDLNYHLLEREGTFKNFIKNRIGELNLSRKPRSDAVVMCQVLVTSDYEFFQRISPEEQRKFFEDSFEFVKKRYGEENIISAVVHLDEKTPHLHINFVPITKDNRLSAKDVFQRKEFTKIHDDFFKDIGKGYGLLRGETKAEKQEHLSVQEFKKKTLEESVEKLDKKLEEVVAKIQYYNNINVDDIENKFDAKESKLNKNNVVITKDDLKEIETLFKLCRVQGNDIQELKYKNAQIDRVNKGLAEKNKTVESKLEQMQKLLEKIDGYLIQKDLKADFVEFVKEQKALEKAKPQKILGRTVSSAKAKGKNLSFDR